MQSTSAARHQRQHPTHAHSSNLDSSVSAASPPAAQRRLDFPQLEEQVLERWRERDVYRESMRRREGAPPYVFYEGPPTANGRPGSHHVLARVFKDVFPRYKTMRGFYSERKGGWDCHGLPVEIAVQNQLGIESKDADRGVRDRGVQRRSAASPCSSSSRTGRG